MISIHALREEGDFTLMLDESSNIQFLSTPSARRATDLHITYNHGNGISIHALREEGDPTFQRVCETPFRFLSTPSARRATHATLRIRRLIVDFYPRPPRGGRLSSLNVRR